MTSEAPKNEEHTLPEYQDGGVYLLIADDSPEFESALRRVAYLAKQNNGHAAILYVIEDESYMHWNFIEKRIQSDKREKAEKFLWEIASRLYESSGLYTGFYIIEGKTRQEIMDVLNTDKTIRALVLGASSTNSNPLVSYFTGKGLSELRLPLVIVPDNM